VLEREEEGEHAAERVHVGARVELDVRAVQVLGRDVAQRAGDRARRGLARAPREAMSSEDGAVYLILDPRPGTGKARASSPAIRVTPPDG